jgi:hypothetical protein
MRVHSLLLLFTFSTTFSVAATLPASSHVFNLTARLPIHTQGIDNLHELQISHYEYQAPDRPYIAALVSASNQNFVAVCPTCFARRPTLLIPPSPNLRAPP